MVKLFGEPPLCSFGWARLEEGDWRSPCRRDCWHFRVYPIVPQRCASFTALRSGVKCASPCRTGCTSI